MKHCITLILVLFGGTAAVCGQSRLVSSSAESGPPGALKVNRTVPKVTPPKTGLEFSATPTAQEILGARVFQEPLVPIGGEPSAEENAALASALLGYSKRRGPDDFSSLTGFWEKPHATSRQPPRIPACQPEPTDSQP